MYKLKKFIINSESHLSLGHKDKLDLFLLKYGKWLIAIAAPFMETFYRDQWFTLDMVVLGMWIVLFLTYLFCLFFCIIDLLKFYLWCKKSIYSHQDFCEFLGIWRKKKGRLPKWVTYPLYIVSIPFTGLFLIQLWIMIQLAMAHVSRPIKYPSDKYRKVVKEGILWDSVEYHER